jgi:hypothetical protein
MLRRSHDFVYFLEYNAMLGFPVLQLLIYTPKFCGHLVGIPSQGAPARGATSIKSILVPSLEPFGHVVPRSLPLGGHQTPRHGPQHSLWTSQSSAEKANAWH